jgi:hypothetical protein
LLFDYSTGIPLYATVATVLAGFTVVLIGLLAQYLLGVGKTDGDGVIPYPVRRNAATNALGVLLPTVAALVVAAYLYAEAGGTASPGPQVDEGSVAALALAGGALLTFLSFVLMVDDQEVSVQTAARLIFWVAAFLTTLATVLGNFSLYRAMYVSGHLLTFYVQSVVFALGFAVFWLLSNGPSCGPLRFVKLTSAWVAVIGVEAIALLFWFPGPASADLHLSIELNDTLAWVRTATWLFILLVAGSRMRGDKSLWTLG